jgi:hypothetical protein
MGHSRPGVNEILHKVHPLLVRLQKVPWHGPFPKQKAWPDALSCFNEK